ncbi:MAG: oligosaccharide flippase family protein, partial [Candidatus Sericytochromatia bacterium]
RDNMNAILGGSIFGPRAVGLLNWGMNVANTCSHAFVQVVGRVSFPAFARLHDQPAERQRLVANSLVWLNLATFPVLAVVAVLADPIVTHVYGEAWRPAIPALICFALRMMGTNTTSILINYLNATGQVKRGFRIAAVWTALEWGLALALLPVFGFYGIAYAYAAGVFLPVFWLLWGLRGELALPLGRAYAAPAAVAAIGAALAWGLGPYATSLPALVAVLVVSGLLSLGAVIGLERDQVLALLARFKARRASEGAA